MSVGRLRLIENFYFIVNNTYLNILIYSLIVVKANFNFVKDNYVTIIYSILISLIDFNIDLLSVLV